MHVYAGLPSALTMSFGASGGFPEITIFCGSTARAADLQAAIAGVIEKHATPAAEAELEAA